MPKAKTGRSAGDGEQYDPCIGAFKNSRDAANRRKGTGAVSRARTLGLVLINSWRQLVKRKRSSDEKPSYINLLLRLAVFLFINTCGFAAGIMRLSGIGVAAEDGCAFPLSRKLQIQRLADACCIFVLSCDRAPGDSPLFILSVPWFP